MAFLNMLYPFAQLGSGIASAAGNLGANRANKQTQDLLNLQAEDLGTLAAPLGEATLDAYAPGGMGRNVLTSLAWQPTEQRLGETLGNARSNAWRYGGAGSGVARKGWRDAVTAAAGQVPEMGGDLEALDTLAKMIATQRGFEGLWNPPQVATNQYSWLYPTLEAFGRGYDPSGRVV